jgi:hypothetical protein
MDEARGRLLKTKKLLSSWKNTLYHTKAQDPYKLELNKDAKDVLRREYRIFDLKNVVKSDVRIYLTI